ncbi:MAG: hypothetical protein WBN11_09810 [Eudoraea sp.]|uniref:hypothetical protein n=1 Tax=Eudoraea sp. TaxID=1979955 RepID=UPI003C75DCCF
MIYYKKIYFLLFMGLVLSCANDDNTNPEEVIKSANLLATGASANDILSNTSFTKLHVELAYVVGFRPTDQTISNLETFLNERTFKNEIEINLRPLNSPEEESLTITQIVELESENRTEYNFDDTLAIYIYFADAPSDGDEPDEGVVTLGASYRNTSMVIHEVTLREFATRSSLISLTDIESATLMHEFGHLFGLVDLGTTPVNNHVDPDSPSHCNEEVCLMRAELEFGMGMMGLLEKSRQAKGAPIPGLDAECILDLQNNGGK